MKLRKNWRLCLIFGFILFLGAAIISRLFFLQILEHKLFKAQALGQQTGIFEVTGSRGQIFCAISGDEKGRSNSGEVKSLATNKDSWTISVSPSAVGDKDFFSEQISQVLGEPKEGILLALNSSQPFSVIKENISSEQLEKVKILGLEGLIWKNNSGRVYPQEKFLAQTLGFLGGEGKGQYGLEGHYEEILQGKSGIREEKRGIASLAAVKEVSLDGSDIYLTVDYNIQFQAEALLKKAEQDLQISSGQIIVMKPDSGRILALADYPQFNPNLYSKEKNLEIFQNSAVQKLFEPGSIIKPFTMAAAINEGKITPQTTYVDTGEVKIGPETIHNFAYEVYGEKTMTEVLENSINTGAIFAQKQISHKTFMEYVDKFGFTKKTGIDLQGEVNSRNEILRNGREINFATASFGQGIELTPIQIITAYSALANKGRLVKPHIVEKIASGGDEEYVWPEVSDAVISEKTALDVTNMLVSVVENGFNGIEKIPGYYMAGKTGTAQIPLRNGKGYEPDKTIQSFVGYGPVPNPQFIILVKLDDPKVSMSALSAVPIYKELARFILNYWKIPPNYDIE